MSSCLCGSPLYRVFCDTLKEGIANGLEKKGSPKVQVCHESRVGLLVTAIEMEAGPPVAVSGSSQQICTRESQGSVKRLWSDIASGEDKAGPLQG